MQIAKTLQYKPGMNFTDLEELVQELQLEANWCDAMLTDCKDWEAEKYENYMAALNEQVVQVEKALAVLNKAGSEINLSLV